MNFLQYVQDIGYPQILLDDVIKHVHKYTYSFYIKGKIQIAPKWELKIIQKILKDYLNMYYNTNTISKNATAYIRGKSISFNVDRHQGNSYFFTTDFKNFFPSIKMKNVKNILSEILYDETENSKKYIYEIIFYKDKLQYGFPTSPIISNLIMKKFDDTLQDKLNTVFLDKSPKYTRYSDDITISSKYKIQKYKILEEVNKLINTSYTFLTINDNKTRVFEKYAKNPKITGLIPLTNRNSIGKKKFNYIKLNIFLLIKGGKITNRKFFTNKKSLISYLSYLYNVDPHNYNRLQVYFNKRYEHNLLKSIFIY